MSESADIVIVGGGLAGLTAANRAAELGRSVIVLEAGEGEDYYCNSRICMGFINVAMGDIEAGPDSMRRSVDAVTRGFAKPELRDALAENAQAALRWLRRQGVTIIKGTWRPSNQAMLAPPSALGAGLTWRGRGGDRMLRVLAVQLKARGGALRRGVRARELVMRDGACVGVFVESAGARSRALSPPQRSGASAAPHLGCQSGFDAQTRHPRARKCAKMDMKRDASVGLLEGIDESAWASEEVLFSAHNKR